MLEWRTKADQRYTL